MRDYSTEESIQKLQKLGKILRSEISREHTMTRQERAAVREAVRIQTLHREKFKQEEKKLREKQHKHRL
jgi:hypothetical protein